MGVKKFPEPIDSITNSELTWDEANDQLVASHDGTLVDANIYPGLQVEYHSNDVLSPVATLRKSRDVKAAPAVCANGDGLGIIQFAAYNGTDYNSNAALVATITGVLGATAFPTELLFATNDGATGFTTKRLTINSQGSTSIGTAAIATTATDGFLYITSCAGVPTGVPTTITGRVPLVVDSTNNKLKMYVNGAWRDVIVASGGSATTFEANLGSPAKWQGKFIVTDAAISPASKVNIWQSAGPYTGKGTRADEAEMDRITAYAEPGSGSMVVKWRSVEGYVPVSSAPRVFNQFITVAAARDIASEASPQMGVQVRGRVKGNVKFTYTIS